MPHNEGIKEDILRQGRFITICLAALLAMAIAPAWASATPASFVDTFAGGTPDANTQVVGGAVQLKPTVGIDEGFSGTALPTGWTSTPWGAGGDATVSGGVLNVDGTLVGPTETFTAPQTLAFTATFGDQPFRHVGFGTNFNDPPWAMFSTGGGALATGLYARTNIGGAVVNEAIVGFDPTVAHAYVIQWAATEVRFYVDGTLVSTQAVTLPDAQRVLASDFNVGGGALTVDQLSLTSYPASGIFTSQVFDASTHVTAWGALAGQGDLAGVTFQTRSGNTAAPDTTWSDWQTVGAGGAVQSPVRRYLQYRAILTGDGFSTPSVTRVTIGYDVDNTGPSVSIGGVTVALNSATVSFSSPDADVARFECSLDGGAFGVCASPKQYTGLTVGNHTVTVRAIDKLGNVGAVASRTFTILKPVVPDTTGPVVKPTPRSVRASRSGRVAFRVRCPKTEQRCKITLQLKRGHKVVSSKKTVRLAGGKRARLTLRLTKKYRRYLSTHARLKAKAVTVATDAANNRKTTRVKVTVRAPKR
jgi:hypothetical protein